MQKYAFIDRDGTIIWEPPRPVGADLRETFELKSADQVKLMEGAIDGMKTLLKKGFLLVMATNQSYLGTPRHPREVFDQVMEKTFSELEQNNIHFEFVMVCPHGPDEGCNCRKPKIGGVEQFLQDHPADLPNSLMFGDRDTDGEFAKNLGVRFVRIVTNEKFVVPNNI